MDKFLKELRKPFHPTQITWKPGSMTQDKTRALAMAYGDLRAYMNRLDEVCGMNWQVSYTPWGDRVICNLTINGVTRSSTGEPDTQSERQEIAGTATEAQAFKRACAMFGLGRYLYSLPSLWVEYDPQAKGFSEKGKARLNQIVTQHYQRAMQADADVDMEDTPEAAGKAQGAPAPTNGQNRTAVTSPASQEPSEGTQSPVALLESLGKELYKDLWPSTLKHNIHRVSGGKATIVSELSHEEVSKLVEGMKSLKRKRGGQPAAK